MIGPGARRVAPLLLGAMLARPPAARPATPPAVAERAHEITIDVRGPLALVRVTRTLDADGGPERLLDVALPDSAALVDVALGHGGRWRAVTPVDAQRARDVYAERLAARGATPAREPFDDSATTRIRVARLADTVRGPVEVRYRFVLLPDLVAGRARVRFPGSPEMTPVPATVEVWARDVTDLEIAGARTTFARAGRALARGRVSTRSGWEVSWAPRSAPARDAVALEGSAAWASLGPTEAAVAVAARARGRRSVGLPPNVLFLIDRSRSVGLSGLADERDLARKLLEALPPSTRFDALFFDRGTTRLFPMSRPATREAMVALEAEMVPDRLRNGTDLPAALRDTGALLRREASAFGPRTLVAIVTDGALPEGPDGAALDRALGIVPDVDVTVAAWTVRPSDDEPPPPAATRALRELAARRGGVSRAVRPDQLDEALPPALAALDRGGDVTDVRLRFDGAPRATRAGGVTRDVAAQLAPGDGEAAALTLPAPSAGGRPALELVGTTRGALARARLQPARVDAARLRALTAGARPTRLLDGDGLVALVEPVVRPAPAPEPPPRGLARAHGRPQHARVGVHAAGAGLLPGALRRDGRLA